MDMNIYTNFLIYIYIYFHKLYNENLNRGGGPDDKYPPRDIFLLL